MFNLKISPNRMLLLATAAITVLAPVLCVAEDDVASAQVQAVGVYKLEAKTFPIVNELPGRIAATRISEVRARVSGILEERIFEQGALVNAGDVLYRIDSRLFRARVSSAEAALQRSKATQTNALQQLARQKSLRDRNVGTGIDYDIAAVNLAQSDADVASAEAVLEEARINLEFTEVRAPISGRIGGALVTEGALVNAGSGSSLALIQQLDPVYADFTQSVQELMKLKQAAAAGLMSNTSSDSTRVELVFDDGSIYPHSGKLLFSNANVDPNTGQVTLRGEFPNPSGDLLPGMYVRVRIEQGIRRNALMVPQRAVSRNEDGDAQVYIVNKNTAEVRDVTLGRPSGSNWLVESGLKDGEMIVVDGVQKVQPGSKIKPEPWVSSKASSNLALVRNKE